MSDSEASIYRILYFIIVLSPENNNIYVVMRPFLGFAATIVFPSYSEGEGEVRGLQSATTPLEFILNVFVVS